MQLRTDVKTDLNWLSIHLSQENGSAKFIITKDTIDSIRSTLPREHDLILSWPYWVFHEIVVLNSKSAIFP